MGNNRIVNQNRLGKYYWQTANLIDDLGLSVYAFRLYCHLVRVSSLDNVDIATRALAKSCSISIGKVCQAKTELEAAKLISITPMKGNRGRPFHIITILDIAERNIQHCQSSSHELNRSPHELISSRGDTPYKNNQKHIYRKRTSRIPQVADSTEEEREAARLQAQQRITARRANGFVPLEQR